MKAYVLFLILFSVTVYAEKAGNIGKGHVQLTLFEGGIKKEYKDKEESKTHGGFGLLYFLSDSFETGTKFKIAKSTLDGFSVDGALIVKYYLGIHGRFAPNIVTSIGLGKDQESMYQSFALGPSVDIMVANSLAVTPFFGYIGRVGKKTIHTIEFSWSISVFL